jgi:hypothetical protein
MKKQYNTDINYLCTVRSMDETVLVCFLTKESDKTRNCMVLNTQDISRYAALSAPSHEAVNVMNL